MATMDHHILSQDAKIQQRHKRFAVAITVSTRRIVSYALEKNDWSNGALNKLAHQIEVNLNLLRLIHCHPNDLDWSSTKTAIQELERKLRGRSQPPTWLEITKQCSQLAVFNDLSNPTNNLQDRVLVDYSSIQTLKYLDHLDLSTPKPAHRHFHDQFICNSLDPTAPLPNSGSSLWLHLMFATHFQQKQYCQSSMALVWYRFMRWIEDVGQHMLTLIGITSNLYATPFRVSWEEAEEIRSTRAVPRSDGVGFHITEVTEDRQHPRELDLAIFPSVKPHKHELGINPPVTGAFRMSSLAFLWMDESIDAMLEGRILDMDIVLTAYHPVHWTSTDDPDLFVFLGLR